MKLSLFKTTIMFVLLLTTTAYCQQQGLGFSFYGGGARSEGMGQAYIALSDDGSAGNWNPAGLSYMQQSEAQFLYQPWFVDINTSITSIGLVFPAIGTVAISLINVGYGDMDVTTLGMQDGTGELFSASDLALSVSYARKLAQWFAFGASAKYISSKIWHSSASAVALDLGVLVNTNFFSITGNRDDGLTIGMSISNYGTKMTYDGMDLLQPIDILPDEEGNYQGVMGKFKTEQWELPLIFRIGISIKPVKVGPHSLTLAVDALHPNNNCESVNMGGEYKLKVPTVGDFYLRGGYKALFMEDSEFGFSFGGGVVMRMLNNVAFKVDYAYRGIGILGKVHCYTLGILF